jgi:uncharacterized protein YchJ
VKNSLKKVPYCDYFVVEEDWLVLSTESDAEACIVRQTLFQEFIKSTWLKSKIEKETYS